MIENIRIKYPDVNIKGFTCPPNLSYEELLNENFIDDIITKNPDILWVSLVFQNKNNLST